MTNQNKMDDKFKKTMQKILVAFIITLAVIVVGAFIYIYIRSPKTTNPSSVVRIHIPIHRKCTSPLRK